MKFFRLRTYWLLPVLLLAACGKSNLRETGPQGECRIEKTLVVSRSSIFNTTTQTLYTYDGDGRLTKKTQETDTKYTPGPTGNQTYTVTDAYAYDADGFLSTSTNETRERSTGLNGVVIAVDGSSRTAYAYTNGRLTGYQTNRTRTRDGAAPTTSTMTGTLDYDAAGELIRKTERSDPNTAQVWMYRQGKVTDFVQYFPKGETRPFTLEDGLVVEGKFPGDQLLQLKNTYDVRQRLTRSSECLDGKLTQYRTAGWSDAQDAEATLPAFKGFPVVQSEWGRPGVLVQQSQFYINALNGTTQHFSEETRTNQTNAKGFVTQSEEEIRYLNPQTLPQGLTTTRTYTYTGCD